MIKFKQEEQFVPRLRVMGVGGGGCNAIASMVRNGELDAIELIAVNTDQQHLEKCPAKIKIQIGKHLCRGLGAGADPDVGREAALENIDEIKDAIEGTDILFLLGGLGGGTGTGALPVIAETARQMGVLTIGVVSKPFSFEGRARNEKADRGVEQLRQSIDTIICIPNDRLFEIIGENTSLLDAFSVTDNILCEGVRAISSLLSNTGYINVDFADMRTIMREKGRAILSFGEGSGKGKAINAIEAAMMSPFVEWHDISNAKAILINFSGGRDLTLFEINDALKVVKRIISPDANVIFGAVIDENVHDRASVTLMITGIPTEVYSQSPDYSNARSMMQEETQQQQQQQLVVPAAAEENEIRMAVAAEQRAEQAVMDFPKEDRGIFEKMSPTMYYGENLDLPPWMRSRGVEVENNN